MKSPAIFQKKAIIFRLLGSEKSLSDFLFESSAETILRESPAALLADSWELTFEQQILVRASLDIWNGSGNVFLWELLRLSEKNFSRLLVALNQYRKLERPVEFKNDQQ